MEVRICARCIMSETTQNLNIKLSNVNCTIWDLKKILEPKLSVAASDQTMYYEKRLLEDRRSLKGLYVQEGDIFNVEYMACCNIEKLRSVLRRLKRFSETVCESLYNKGLQTGSVTGKREQFDDCFDDVYEVFDICAYELFIPWKNQACAANRHFFTQEGGLDILSSIYKFTQTTFQLTEKIKETEMLESVTTNQKILEHGCLQTLWNYSELKKDRQMVLKKIGLDMFIMSLIKDPCLIAHKVDSDVVRINESAAGCLAQYIEMPDIQQYVGEHHLEAATKLVWLSSHGTTLYHKEVATNTLFCCSNHPKAASKLLENKVHQSVITKMMPLLSISGTNEELADLVVRNGLSMAMQYFFCLFLANIETLPEERILTDEEKSCMDEIIEKFLCLHTPSEVGEFEAEHHYVWISLAPFVELALSPPNAKTLKSREAMKQLSSAAKVGLFSLCQLVKLRMNRELFKKENLVDYLVCICWFARKCDGNSLVPELTGFEQLEPPQLQIIAKASLARFYGCKITQF